MNYWAGHKHATVWMPKLRNCGLGSPLKGRHTEVEAKLGALLKDEIVPYYNAHHVDTIILIGMYISHALVICTYYMRLLYAHLILYILHVRCRP